MLGIGIGPGPHDLEPEWNASNASTPCTAS
ncbi:hypothetical protein ACVWZN_002180 [Lysobacter sp. HA35]